MEHDLQLQSFEFALTIVRLYKKLQARQELTISPQLLKSGARIGLAIEEALATSDAHRSEAIEVARREARETFYWLRLLEASRLADVDVTQEIAQVKQLLELLSAGRSISGHE